MKSFGGILNYSENPLWTVFFSLKRVATARMCSLQEQKPTIREKKTQDVSTRESLALFKIQRPQFLPPVYYSEIARGSFLSQLPVGFLTLSELVEMKKIISLHLLALSKPEVIKAKSLSLQEELKMLTFEEKMSVLAFAQWERLKIIELLDAECDFLVKSWLDL